MNNFYNVVPMKIVKYILWWGGGSFLISCLFRDFGKSLRL